jgi:hypothetical protein
MKRLAMLGALTAALVAAGPAAAADGGLRAGGTAKHTAVLHAAKGGTVLPAKLVWGTRRASQSRQPRARWRPERRSSSACRPRPGSAQVTT